MEIDLLFVFSFASTIIFCDGQTVSGCPSYGCRPSGTFSFTADIPDDVTYAWNKSYVQGPVPGALGCVGNDVNVICQSNTDKDKGFVCIDPSDGKAVWRDAVLNNPVLPIMDIYGDIIGSDGHKLVKIDSDGTVEKPVIPLGNDIFPIYSLGFADNGIIFIVSKSGLVFSYESDGVPHASIELKGTVERMNGTFVPMTTPVISGSRAYVLTEFKPDGDLPPGDLGLQRLYAIDIFQRMVDRLDIAWMYNFEREAYIPAENEYAQRSNFDEERLRYSQNLQPRIMVNSATNIVYVYLPPPMGSGLEQANQFLWAFKDEDGGHNPDLLFKVPLLLVSMTIFEPNSEVLKQNSKNRNGINMNTHDDKKWTTTNALKSSRPKKYTSETSPLWVLHANKEQILKVSPMNGTVQVIYNVSSILAHGSMVSSDIMNSRSSSGEESIIFGAKLTKPPSLTDNLSFISQPKNATSFVVRISSEGQLKWVVAVPQDMEVVGQISGIQQSNTQSNDQEDDLLVAVASDSKSSVIFAIHGKH